MYKMNTRNYILKDGKPVMEPDIMKWAKWFETRDRIVEQTKIGSVKISTVFLGLDHNYSDSGPPVLWETMVFGGKLDSVMNRCSGSKEQAETMHQEMVRRVELEEKDLFTAS